MRTLGLAVVVPSESGVLAPLGQSPSSSCSKPTQSRPRSPLRYTAEGTPTSTGPSAADTGADFSVYGSDPFYVNSTVKLPLKSSVGTPTGKEPNPPPLPLSALPITPFEGDPRHYPRFRDAFIRMVHAPGRHLEDIDLLDYLLHSLKGDPRRFAESYSYTGGDSYHRITAQLEHRYYDPALARRLLEKELDDMRPVNDNLLDLQRYADDWVRVCGELLTFRENILDNSAYYNRFMEKLPHAVRLELFRNEHEYNEFNLEAAIIELQESIKWHRKATAFQSLDGPPQLGPGTLGGSRFKAVTNGGPKITVLEEHTTGGFMSAARRPRVAICSFCNARGTHRGSSCTAFDIAERRRQRAVELGRCLHCLRKDHHTNNIECRFIDVGLCGHCGKERHHKALCTEYAKRPRKRQQPAADRRQHLSETRQTGSTYSPGTGLPSKGSEDSQPGRRKATKRKARKSRPVPANLAASDATEDSIDGSKASSQPNVGTPAPPMAANGAAPPAAVNVRVPVQRTKLNAELDELGHCSDAPTEPDSDTEEYALGIRQPDGVGGFGATAPCAELRRTHILECVQADVCSPDDTSKKMRVTVFFDSGSSITYLDTFASDAPVRLDIFHTRLAITLADGRLCHVDACASAKIVGRLRTVFISDKDVSLLRKDKCHLVPVHVAPDIVIGRDTQHMFRKKDHPPLLPSGFCLVSSTLGLMIAGSGHITKQTPGRPPPAATAASSVDASGTPESTEAAEPQSAEGSSTSTEVVTTPAFFAVHDYEDAVLNEMGENFWKLENIGIETPTRQLDDDVAHERFRQTITVNDDGRYEVLLPWKTDNGAAPSNAELPTNFGVARGRLTSFQRAHLQTFC
ncbi:Zinc knuckle family protein [Aphelenchoides avenae]|nr:Zinc knuckle family protein [Aphelenchus avenae]